MRVVLASKSPRRKELLRDIFREFDIISSEVDESLPHGTPPVLGVELLAVRKGEAVARELPSSVLVISSDTLVELDGKALGKPESREEAISMLESLSGRSHNVHTGVAVHYCGRLYSGVASTAVHFRKIDRDELLSYVDSGEPMDKAGAYGIQGGAGKFVTGYDGDYDTVVGLSRRLTRELTERAITENGDML